MEVHDQPYTTPTLTSKKELLIPTEIFEGHIFMRLVEVYINACNQVVSILFTDCRHSHIYTMFAQSMKSKGQNAECYPLYPLKSPLL